jgi:hypothetical protein
MRASASFDFAVARFAGADQDKPEAESAEDEEAISKPNTDPQCQGIHSLDPGCSQFNIKPRYNTLQHITT